ncbi:MAG TPA: hypothetical protein VGL77_01665 [Armatimonadota bacterium]|jgi:5-methyltetrahydrofolate--homocysteine methyltransferase
MSIDFGPERWEQLREDARRWWAGELPRPLVQLTAPRDPGRAAPALPRVSRDTTSYDLAVTPEAIVDYVDYSLASQHYLGDAFPGFWPDFGPGVIAAFMGAEATPGDNTVWFHPRQKQGIGDIHFAFDGDNIWYQRMQAINHAALERWQGQVLTAMTDLGGNLDILSTFRPSEELLFDLYDDPDEVKRLTWEAHHVWWQYYDAFNAVLQPVNPGYSAWTSLYSETPYYILQCDFAYMIGPEMFDEFVKPELAATSDRLGNAFYHLDGAGQLPHLDSLLEIPSLKGVQWVPGDGAPSYEHWPQVYRKIRDAGKLVQLWTSMASFDSLVEQVGSAAGFAVMLTDRNPSPSEIDAFFSKYGL